MALRQRAIQGQFANATAVLLAASSTVTRYIRSIHITNNTAAGITWNFAYAATATSAGPGVFAENLVDRTQGYLSRTDRHYGGKGKRIDNVALSGFASVAAGVTYEVIYDESEGVDP